MNIIIAEGDTLHVSSTFSEDPDYFTMYHLPGTGDHPLVICSDPLEGPGGWEPIDNGEVRTFS